MSKYHKFTDHFTYQENRDGITQYVEIDLEGIKDKLKDKVNCIDTGNKDKKVFRFEGETRLIYATEVLIPKPKKDRENLLLLLGNPAIHSIKDGMFFSYERTRGECKWREHRFWDGLRSCGLFTEDPKKPTPDDIAAINTEKKQKLLNGSYRTCFKFNIFLMTYFSFPTPASKKKKDAIDYSGVRGIKKAVEDKIFTEMKEFEFCRFKYIVSSNRIGNIICFQKEAWSEIINRIGKDNIKCIEGNICNEQNHPVCQLKLDDASPVLTLYLAKPTRDIRKNESKKILKAITCDIENRCNVVS